MKPIKEEIKQAIKDGKDFRVITTTKNSFIRYGKDKSESKKRVSPRPKKKITYYENGKVTGFEIIQSGDHLICKDCGAEIFVNTNMVMVKDDLWEKICDKPDDAICVRCIEKRIGREITERDFKGHGKGGLAMIPCNELWLWNKNHKHKSDKLKAK